MNASKFEKKAVFEHLADGIETQIRQEGWKGLLPSGRDLAQKHKVSLPTVQKAIALLAERRVLVSRGGKRRLEVAPGMAGSQRSAGHHEILVLSTRPLSGFDAPISLGLLQLGEHLKLKGDGFRFVDLSRLQGTALRKAAHAEVVKSKPSHCILMAPDANLFAGVSRHRVKIASMYGNLRSNRITRLGIQYGALVDVAVKHLVSLGHRRFFIPFLGRKVKLPKSVAGIARVAKEQGVIIDVHFSSLELTTGNMGALLDAGLAKGATAVLFPQWTDFMPAIAYFGRRDLEFPRDVSVVSLIGTMLSSQFSPPIACCLSLPECVVKQADLWIRSDVLDLAIFDAVFAGTWQAGASTGPAPSKR